MLLCLSAWAAGDPCDPYNADASLKKEDIERCLAQKRDRLAAARAQLDALSDELLESQAALFAARKRLEESEAPQRELEEARARLAALESEAEALSDELLRSQLRLRKLDEQIAAQEITNEELAARREDLVAQVDLMQQRYEIVKAGIQRAGRIRAQHALQ